MPLRSNRPSKTQSAPTGSFPAPTTRSRVSRLGSGWLFFWSGGSCHYLSSRLLAPTRPMKTNRPRASARRCAVRRRETKKASRASRFRVRRPQPEPDCVENDVRHPASYKISLDTSHRLRMGMYVSVNRGVRVLFPASCKPPPGRDSLRDVDHRSTDANKCVRYATASCSSSGTAVPDFAPEDADTSRRRIRDDRLRVRAREMRDDAPRRPTVDTHGSADDIAHILRVERASCAKGMRISFSNLVSCFPK